MTNNTWICLIYFKDGNRKQETQGFWGSALPSDGFSKHCVRIGLTQDWPKPRRLGSLRADKDQGNDFKFRPIWSPSMEGSGVDPGKSWQRTVLDQSFFLQQKGRHLELPLGIEEVDKMYIFSQKNTTLLLQFMLTMDLKCSQLRHQTLHLPSSALRHLSILNWIGKKDQLTVTFKQF